MKLSIDLPDTEKLTKLGSTYLKEILASTLYHTGDLSEKDACDIVGMTRREFEELLPKFGFSILSDTDENIQIELQQT